MVRLHECSKALVDPTGRSSRQSAIWKRGKETLKSNISIDAKAEMQSVSACVAQRIIEYKHAPVTRHCQRAVLINDLKGHIANFHSGRCSNLHPAKHQSVTLLRRPCVRTGLSASQAVRWGITFNPIKQLLESARRCSAASDANKGATQCPIWASHVMRTCGLL